MKFVEVAAIVVAVGLMASCAAPSQEIAGNVQSAGKAERLSSIRLGPTTQKKFEEFSQGYSAYGAMYVTKNDGGGRAGGQYSLETAKELALAQCRKHNSGQNCILYATISP
ncbi:hypothetical protein Q5Y75_07920 [Ruegeria sp. 2205SS24-7]|uniref:hypothetical protein n=1 Tax=Ruegeria discodermiae TaxID=3064389 RepID=UPI002742691D|nr:hypothetical protein [Ruegeria sp. 2205SS24-7]MDP5217140.1 hypothetical protein [Ruegeria sp. 2205SS24-7]